MDVPAISNKLKCVTFLLAVFCLSWSIQDVLYLQVPTSALLELRQQAETCSKETGVPSSHLRRIIDKTLPNDVPNKQFYQCVAYNSGYVDNEGHIVADKIINWNIVNGTKDDVLKTIEKCNKISKDVNIETLYEITKCVHETFSVTIQS